MYIVQGILAGCRPPVCTFSLLHTRAVCTSRKQGSRAANDQPRSSLRSLCTPRAQPRLRKYRMNRIDYSEKYVDGAFEYRHVMLPKETAKILPKSRLLAEDEWRKLGVQQSRGWQHYAIHRPEPHILLFRRPLGTDPNTGKVDPELEREAKEKYAEEVSMHVRK